MNKLQIFIGFLGILMTSACANRHLTTNQDSKQKELLTVVKMMTGSFSSAEQAAIDSLFYNINLVMYPIWETNKSAKWLYVEQAVTKYIDKPYRQRVYKLTVKNDGVLESSVFELPDPKKYIHGWTQPTIFNQINPDSLIVREGCAVFLKKENNCYSGSTKDKECKSTLRGAAYATSQVSICADEIVSWDQGWDNTDEQVWGAEIKGYIFKRM